MKKSFLLSIALWAIFIGSAQSQSTQFRDAPAWSRNVIWYQVFVERFYNGDHSNDPGPANINVPPMDRIVPKDWTISPWTGDWYAQPGWEAGKPFNDIVTMRRYGGDLQGVLDKLDYLQQLGITALFLNPINDAPSMHKYDARNYHHVDVNFGPDPAGDNKIIAGENPEDPSTWKWTSADRMFLKLVDEAHKRKMKIIMDYSWNHTGTMFWAWQDVLKNQSASQYKDWYDIKSFDNPSTTANEFDYAGWVGIKDLPELKKVDVATTRVNGKPYEGNINEGAKQHIMAVTKRWLAPDGNVAHGIDGFRMDVADQIGLGFWRDFRKAVRQINPDTYLVGEIWWEEWPDHLMDPAPYTGGDIFDAVMFYQAYRPARYFFAKNDYSIDARQFKDSLEFQWNRLSKDKRYAMMNVSSSHDAPRLLTDFYNPNKYKYKAKPQDDPLYKTGKPDPETYQRVRLYLAHLFTTIGAPEIWNGEEFGMWGSDDPDPRKPLWWKEYKFSGESRNNFQPGKRVYDPVGFNQQQFDWYKKLIAIRNKNPVLSTGDIRFLTAEGKKLAYSRYDDNNEVIACFNLGTTTTEFQLPQGNRYINLLTNEKVVQGVLKLKGLNAAILKRVK